MKQMPQLFDKSCWIRGGVKLISILLLMILLQEGFLLQFDTLQRSENPFRNVSIFLILWGLTFLGVFFTSVIHIRSVRIFWGLWFAISIFAYLTFTNIFGYAPTLGDVKILWVETGQRNAAFMFYWKETIFPLFITLIFLVVFLLPLRTKKLFKNRLVLSIVTLLPLLPFIMLTGMLVIKGGGAGVGTPAGFLSTSSYLASIKYETNLQPDIHRQPVAYVSNTESRIKNIILVVDESISGDFISLNPRNTITPILVENSERIIDFGEVSSGHNCSSYSNSILRWGVSLNNLSKAETLPTIWQYARAAGYTTTYIDSQKQPGTYGNYMTLSEAAEIDNFVQFKSPQIERGLSYITNDFKAADKAADLISQSEMNFIYINKLGAHVPYEGKYPEESAKYHPHMSLFEPVSDTSRERMINSYKNAISWNLNGFFQRLLNRDQLKDTVILYTSDHGQNLLDAGVATHCGRGTHSQYEALVPLLILTDNNLQYRLFSKSVLKNRNKASHFNIFPTLLELMGYPVSQVEEDYTVSLFSPIKRLGKYSRGDLFSSKINKRNYRWSEIDSGLKPRM